MKDGEIRLEEALPFLGVFRNGLFQGGDDEGLGSFINGAQEGREDGGIGDIALLFQEREESNGFLYAFLGGFDGRVAIFDALQLACISKNKIVISDRKGYYVNKYPLDHVIMLVR
jgi:hypothetical protein